MKTTLALVASFSILYGDGTFAADTPATKSTNQPNTKAAAKKGAPAETISPAPTMADVPYGPHPKQVLPFWKADSDKPMPLLFFIHGGGWQGGNRMSGLVAMLPEMLKAGISVVSVEYRFISEAHATGVNLRSLVRERGFEPATILNPFIPVPVVHLSPQSPDGKKIVAALSYYEPRVRRCEERLNDLLDNQKPEAAGRNGPQRSREDR